MFVVYWHNIVPESNGVWDEALPRLTTDAFERQVAWISRHFNPVDLSEVLHPASSGNNADRRLAMTFDDGFLGVKEIALPILRKYGWTGTVFVLNPSPKGDEASPLMHAEFLEIAFRLTRESTFEDRPLSDDQARCKAYREWKKRMRPLNARERTELCQETAVSLNVTIQAIHDFAANHPETYAKLSVADCLQLLEAGWNIGAHTENHLHLTELSSEQIRREIGDGSRCLDRNGKRFFAYPYGDVDSRVANEAQSLGFDAAFTTDPRRIGIEDSLYLLPRMSFGSLWTRAMKHAGRASRSDAAG